jgi:BirA family transcriptional regulator, biotin operon repressor / biotin---[acetyl-CoA-carboxylase] ligase
LTISTTAPTRNYATIDSTNLEARRLFALGERGPLFVLADEQSAGRGRLDRKWASPRGNCYSTLILPIMADITTAPQIGFVAALAVADTLVTFGIEPQLKWPNDVLVNGAKIAGILCEVLAQDPLTIAIGCGINVAHAPTGLAYPATCVNAETNAATRDEVYAAYQAALMVRGGIWDNGKGFPAIRAAWNRFAAGLGETVTFHIGTECLTGVFHGITEQGAITLKPALGPPHILHAGDLTIPSLLELRNKTA